MRKKNSISSSDLMFEEEVSDQEVYDKSGHSDVIYKSSNSKVKFLIVLAIILIIISIQWVFIC